MTVNDEVAATLANVPADERILVTDHDALGYLAAAYGYTVAGTVIPGGSTLAEPSSAELAALAATVRRPGSRRSSPTRPTRRRWSTRWPRRSATSRWSTSTSTVSGRPGPRPAPTSGW